MRFIQGLTCLIFLFYSACSKHEASTSGSAGLITGVVQAGRVSDATVKVYKIKDGARDELLGETKTDSEGNYSISVVPKTDPVEIVATHGSYTDEATGETVRMDSNDELSVVIEDSLTFKTAPVTPITTQVRDRVIAQIESGNITMSQFSAAKEAALEEVAQAYGTDKNAIMAIPSKPESPGSSVSNEAKGAYLLATLSQYLKDKNLSPSNGINPLDALKEISKDLKNDGKLDGKDSGTPVSSTYATLSTSWSSGMSQAAENLKSNDKTQGFKSFDKTSMGIGQFKTEPEIKMAAVSRNGQTQVTICHIPPGYEANKHTISIGEAAVDAHLAHGDSRGACSSGSSGSGGSTNTSNIWTSITTNGAPTPRWKHTAVWTGSKMIVWGGTYNGSQNTGGIYNPETDSWTETSTVGAPVGRSEHTALWTGTKMLIWGGINNSTGELNSGAQYDPVNNTWTAMTTVNAPTGRNAHMAVWTGTKMIIWGNNDSGTGGQYDPATDTWTSMTTTNAPAKQLLSIAVWTGSKALIWGGENNAGISVNLGGLFDPINDSWTSVTPSTFDLYASMSRNGVWTGSKMLVWGGLQSNGQLNTRGQYDPATDTWGSISNTNAPVPRQLFTSVWTGSKMIVWGGRILGSSSTVDTNTGGLYDPITDSWTATATPSTLPEIHSHTAVWTGSKMIIWGGGLNDGTGLPYGGVLNTGFIYVP